MDKGFNNIGNSCFFNAALQLLKLPFAHIITQEDWYLKPDDIFSTIYEFYSKVLADNVTKEDYQMLYLMTMGRLKYNTLTQQDSGEVIQLFLNKMTSYSKSKEDICIVWNEIHSCAKCDEYKILDKQINNILYSNALNVLDGRYIKFADFLKYTLARNPGENKDFKCKCDRPIIRVQSALTKLPRFLIINIARYINGTGRKVDKPLEIASKLNITTPVDLDGRITGKNREIINNTYKLSGIVVHYGHTLNSGHYIAYGKRPDGWKLFDDNSVTDIKELKLDDNTIMSNAYVLLYSRV